MSTVLNAGTSLPSLFPHIFHTWSLLPINRQCGCTAPLNTTFPDRSKLWCWLQTTDKRTFIICRNRTSRSGGSQVRHSGLQTGHRKRGQSFMSPFPPDDTSKSYECFVPNPFQFIYQLPWNSSLLSHWRQTFRWATKLNFLSIKLDTKWQ